MEKQDVEKLSQEFVQKFEGLNELKRITAKMPNRMTGTENGNRAEEYIYQKLKNYGYAVRFDPFRMKSWQRKTGAVGIYSADKSWEIDTLSFAYTPVRSDVIAPIIDVGDGLYEDFKAKADQIPGSIVLVNMKLQDIERIRKKEINPLRTDKTKFARIFGAKGALFVNAWTGQLLTTGTVGQGPGKGTISIPALCISKEEGQNLREALHGGQLIQGHIHATSEMNPVIVRNVVASLPGLENPEERILIGGHLDSWDMSTAATDNGMGTFAVLDIARAFAQAKIVPRRTVEFIFWMGEEHGLFGSTAFVKKEIEKGTLSSIRYYLNIDYMTNPNGFDIEGREEMKAFFDSIGDKVKKAGFDFENDNSGYPTLAPEYDTAVFVAAGIPTVQENHKMPGHIYRYYHTTKDRILLVNKEHMIKSSLAMGYALYYLSTVPVIGTKPLNTDETKEFLKEFGGGGDLMVSRFHWPLRKRMENMNKNSTKKNTSPS